MAKAKYEEAELIAGITRLAEQLGHVPNCQEYELFSRDVPGVACLQTLFLRFSSYRAAVERAGLVPVRLGSITDGELIAELQGLAIALGRVPSSLDVTSMRRSGGTRFSHQTYFTRFGSWSKAQAAAGIKGGYHVTTRAELLCHLRKVAAELEHAPTILELEDAEGPCAGTYMRRFGSWKKALRAAGLLRQVAKRPPRERKFTTEGLLSYLRTYSEAHGHAPSIEHFRKAEPGKPNYRSFYRFFGSYKAAVRAAGVQAVCRGRKKVWDRGRLLAALHIVAEQTGRRPKVADFRSVSGRPSYETFYRTFGSFREALRAATLLA